MLTSRIDHVAAALHPGASHHVTTISILAAFVAINTVMYAGLALVKMLPRIRLGAMLQRSYVRSETRSIYPADHGWSPRRDSGR